MAGEGAAGSGSEIVLPAEDAVTGAAITDAAISEISVTSGQAPENGEAPDGDGSGDAASSEETALPDAVTTAEAVAAGNGTASAITAGGISTPGGITAAAIVTSEAVVTQEALNDEPIVPLAELNPATLSYQVNAAVDGGVTNGVKYTLTNVNANVSSGTAQFGSVSVTVPSGLTAALTTGTIAAPRAGWAGTQSGGSITWIITTPATNGTKAIVDAFLNSNIYFRLTTPGVFPADGAKIAVQVSVLQVSSWVDPSGRRHYYQYYGGNNNWITSYNLAKNNTFNGLRGYLATITSQAEQDFIYNSIAKNAGWLGGTRMLVGTSSAGARINDQVSLTVPGSFTSLYYAAELDPKMWYWACGPEAAKPFYYGARYNDGGHYIVTPAQGGFGFSYFNNPLVSGGTSSEPNSASNEHCLQFAFNSNPRWNDFSWNQTAINGYYVEYGGYDNDSSVFTSNGLLEQDLPQPVYSTFKSSATGAVLSAQTFTIGKIGNNYSAPALGTVPVGYTYQGLASVSAPVSGQYANAKKTVNHLYTPIVYTVTYNKNATDATGTMANGSATYDASFTLAANAFVRNGYNFVNWNTAANGSGTTYTNSQIINPWKLTSNLTLYAQWTAKGGFTIKYNANGGAPTPANKTNVKWTDTGHIPAQPSRTGYTFAGWKLTARGATAYDGPTVTAADSYAVLAAQDTVTDVTLTAQWTENNSYTVKYDTNGGTPGTIADKTGQTWASTGLIPAQPVRAGYTFAGWKLTARGATPYGGTAIMATAATAYSVLAAADTVMNVTIQAQWTENNSYVVKYDTNGGTPGTIADKTGQTWASTGLLPAQPVRAGYTFTGWKLTARGATPYTGTTITATAATAYSALAATDTVMNVTIQAQWTENNSYTVKYDTNGGTPGTIADKTGQTWASTGLIPAQPSRVGYVFAGWKLTARGATPYGGTVIMATAATAYSTLAAADTVANVTLTAQWTENSNYTVKYNTNGGTPATIADKTSVKWTDTGLLPAQPVRAGYTFGGWKLTARGATAYNGPVATATDSYGALALADTVMDITLTAQWDEIGNYSLHYDVNGATAPIASLTNIGWTRTNMIPATPVRPGYSFTGWKLSKRGAANYIGPDINVTAATSYGSLAGADTTMEVTIQAQWTEKSSYIVKYLTNGGSPATIADKTTVKWTDTGLLPAQPTRMGYVFAGWKLTARGATPYTGTVITATAATAYSTLAGADTVMNVTLTAQWTENSNYTVKYNTNGGLPATIADKTSVKWTNTGLLPAQPSRAGYAFAGWQLTARDGAAYAGPAVTATAATAYSTLAAADTVMNVTLTAQWTENSGYAVKYLTNGGSPASIADKTNVKWTDTGLLPAQPSRAGYSFTGWKLTARGGAAYAGPAITATASDSYGTLAGGVGSVMSVTLTAQWTANTNTPYNISHYKVINGSVILAETRSESGTTATTVSEPPKSYPGYTYAPAYPGSLASATLAGNGSTHLKLYYTANTNTAYKVEHYQVNSLGTATLKDTDNKTGVTDTPSSYTARSYPGFTLKLSHPGTVASGNIAGNGSLVLKLYYTANTNTPYRATHYKVVNGTHSAAVDRNLTGTTTAVVSESPMSFPGYTYDPAYIGTLTSAPIAGDGSTHLKLYYAANVNTPYRVEHYTVDAADNKVLRDSENLTGTTDTPAAYTLRDYPGHLYEEAYPLSTAGARINGDGSTVIRLYYVVTYLVDFVDWDDKPISNQEVIKGHDAAEPDPPARSGHVFYSWNGDWHNVDSDRVIQAIYIPADWQYQAPPPAPGTTTPRTGITRPTIPAAPETTEEPEQTQPEEPPKPVLTPTPGPVNPIESTPPPLAAPESSWALLNLILTVLALAMAIILLVSYFTGRREEREDESNGKVKIIERHLLMRLLSLVAAAGAIVLFLLTEDMSNPITLFDNFTLFHAAIVIVQVVLALFSRKYYGEEDEETY
jgi:uncharacterized repeat protein (TIGR02543 family)